MDAAMRRLIEKASEINMQEAKHHPESRYTEALGSSLARHMGEAFNSRYSVEDSEDSFKVILKECGCIGCIMKDSSEFGFDDATCRAIFCRACLGGYRLSAEKLGVKFKGSLTPLGCSMTFSSPNR